MPCLNIIVVKCFALHTTQKKDRTGKFETCLLFAHLSKLQYHTPLKFAWRDKRCWFISSHSLTKQSLKHSPLVKSVATRTNTSWMCRIYVYDGCVHFPAVRSAKNERSRSPACLGVSRCFIYNFIIIVRAWWMHWHLNAFVQQKWVYIKKWRD
jgi:hypothetical protein